MYITLLMLWPVSRWGVYTYRSVNIPKSTYEPDRMKGWTMLAFQHKIDTYLTNKPAGHRVVGDKAPL